MIVCCMLSNRPPLRQYLLDGEFFVGAAIACTLAKLALRYLDMEEDKEKQNVSLWLHYINFSSFFVINRHRPCIFFRTAAGLVSLVCQRSEMLQFYFTLSIPRLLTCLFLFLQVFCATCILIMASILHLGKSGLPKKVCALEMVWGSAALRSDPVRCIQCCCCFLQIITDDDVDRISLCVRVVAERVPLMKNIFTVECRNSLSSMLDANKRGEEEKMSKVHLIYVTFTRERKPTVNNFEEKIDYFQLQRELTCDAESA